MSWSRSGTVLRRRCRNLRCTKPRGTSPGYGYLIQLVAARLIRSTSALRSIHRKLDDRPISMKLYEFAAIDGPEKTSAPEMHQRIIAMATEQSRSAPEAMRKI